MKKRTKHICSNHKRRKFQETVPAILPHKARTRQYRGSLRRFIHTRFFETHTEVWTNAIKQLILFKCITANASSIWQHAAHTTDQLTSSCEIDQLVSCCFEPSQPRRIISGLRETFIKSYVAERSSKAEVKTRIKK